MKQTFLTVLEARKPRIKAPVDLAPRKVPLPDLQTMSSHCVFKWKKKEKEREREKRERERERERACMHERAHWFFLLYS
jgi:hypothetical protein